MERNLRNRVRLAPTNNTRVKHDSMEDLNIMELGKQYIVAGVSGALVWMAFWYAPYAVEGALPIVFALAIGIGIGAVSRGE